MIKADTKNKYLYQLIKLILQDHPPKPPSKHSSILQIHRYKKMKGNCFRILIEVGSGDRDIFIDMRDIGIMNN